MDQLSGGTANNPRMDLLHGTGDNQQLNYAQAASPAPAPAPAQTPPPPAPPIPAPELVPVAPSPQRPATAPTITSTSAPRSSAQPSSSHKPVIIGVIIALLLLAGVGVGGWWYLTQRTTETVNTPTPVEVTPVTPTELTQSTSSGGAIDAGKTAGSATITLGFTGATAANSGQLTPEVEIQPLSTAFTNQPNLTGDAVSANGHDMTFKVNTDKLAEGKYHWQARLDKGDQHSDWAIFGGDASAAAFVVDVTAPGTPAVTSIGGKSLANPVVVQSNRPEFKGTSEPNAKISLAIGPDNTTLNAVADASGSWSVAASSDVANGTHEVSVIATDEAGNASQPTKVALSVNPATAADVAPQPAAVTPAVNPQPAQTPTKLANTGDNVMTASLVAALVLMMALAGLMLNRRRYGLN